MTTAAEKRHLSRVASLGCIVCHENGEHGGFAEIHHPRFSSGMAQRASHYLSIPLCANHHRYGVHGVAIHAGQEIFERMYGTEAELLAKTIQLLMEE